MEKKDYAIIELPGTPGEDALARTLQDALHTGKRNVVLDCRKLENACSREISLLVHAYKKLKAVGGRLCLVNANKTITEVLAVVNLDKMIPVFPSLEAFETEKDLPDAGIDADNDVRMAAETTPRYVKVTVSGSAIGHACYQKIKTFFSALEPQSSRFLFDISKLDSLDSQTVWYFMEFGNRVKKKNGLVAVANPSAIVRELFEILELEHLFALFPSVAEAESYLSKEIQK